MDAVSGVSAVVQLADLSFRSLFKIYCIARDATEIPRRLKNTLLHIENFQALLQHLQEEVARPNSKLATDSNQSQRLITTLKAIATCADGLSTSLEKILPSSSDSKVKRTWRGLASISKEDGILEQCDRLNSLKQDLQLELQLIGISLFSQAR